MRLRTAERRQECSRGAIETLPDQSLSAKANRQWRQPIAKLNLFVLCEMRCRQHFQRTLSRGMSSGPAASSSVASALHAASCTCWLWSNTRASRPCTIKDGANEQANPQARNATHTPGKVK